MVPFPLPLLADVNAIHDAPLLALHAHPAAALTEIEPAPPRADREALVGLIV
jgi:hypothetical protein